MVRDSASRLRRGFTLIELLVVLAIVALLLSIAMPRYVKSLDTANETVLVENLVRTREVIDKYYADTGAYPESLEELVEKKYLRALPYDPVADSATNWVIVPPDPAYKGKVFNLRSAAPGTDRAGRRFAEL